MSAGPGVDGPLAWKPKVADAPGVRLVDQLGALIVQVVPDGVMVELQALVRVTPDGMVQVTVQLFQVVVPVFRTVTLVVKPPCQALGTW
jgi:hypothetical protein